MSNPEIPLLKNRDPRILNRSLAQPRISVIITNYNYGEFVSSAIQSVLDQTYRNTECIVVDDGSNDDSASKIRSFDHISTIFQPNSGQASAARRGLEIATGSIVIFLDADDFLLPHACSEVAQRWKPGLQALFYKLHVLKNGVVLSETLPHQPFVRQAADDFVLRHGYLPCSPTSGNAFAKSCADEIFSKSINLTRDGVDAWLAYCAPFLGPCDAIDKPLGVYRIHGANISLSSSVDVRRIKSHLFNQFWAQQSARAFALRQGKKKESWTYLKGPYNLKLFLLTKHIRDAELDIPDERTLTCLIECIRSFLTAPHIPLSKRLKNAILIPVYCALPDRAKDGVLNRMYGIAAREHDRAATAALPSAPALPAKQPQMIEGLRCPRCRSTLTYSPESERIHCDSAACSYSREGFLVVNGQPVLVDFERSIIDRDEFLARTGDPPIARPMMTFFSAAHLRKILLGTNKVAERMAQTLIRETKALAKKPRVLVIGGGDIGVGAEALYENSEIDLVGTDIYTSIYTRVVADGHHLPFADSTFDGVWIQAVLEHVLDPSIVASEITRVLKLGGIVYADTPFMQQVHEGAYDFTRFTLSGHRWLFRQFDVIDAGPVSGPGTVLIWSIRYLLRALTGSNKIATGGAMLFFWMRFFDNLSSRRLIADAASGVYLLGRKMDRSVQPKDMIAFYENF